MRNLTAIMSAAICLGSLACWSPIASANEGEWPVYGADRAGTKYSALAQIDRENFSKLELAWLRVASPDAALRDARAAYELATALCERERSAEHLDVLAASLARRGRFREAVATAGEARTRAEAQGQAALARRIGERLELYRRERTFEGRP